MNKNKNIQPRNSKGQFHGYNELYYTNGNLWFRVFYKNDQEIGYEEMHSPIYGKTNFYIR